MVSTRANVLLFSLQELEARQGLCNSLQESRIEFLGRRPYIQSHERQLLKSLPSSLLLKYFSPGEFIHVPMCVEERKMVEYFLKFRRLSIGSGDVDSDDFTSLTELLPGRRVEDIKGYFADLDNDLFRDDEILMITESVSDEAVKFCPDERYRKTWVSELKTQFSIFESSGSITAITCRGGILGEDARVMIGACATLDERYNRVGELVLAYKDHYSPQFDAVILDGHKKSKNTPQGLVEMRQTVTCVAYDPLSDIFFTGGYDGDVVAWNASTALAIDTICSHAKPINSIACHPTRLLMIYGCQIGTAYVSVYQDDLRLKKWRPPSVLMNKPKAKESFCNSIDCVAIPQKGAKVDVAYIGIGYLQSSSAGVIEAWDLEKSSMISSAESFSGGLTCMSISACGKMLAAGSGGVITDDFKGDGIVRVLDLDSDFCTGLSIKTDKYDLDCISICPKSLLLFMGETSDGSVLVFDVRFPERPIFSTGHGSPNSDSLVAHAWLEKGDVLVTGGHDGFARIWDCRRGFSLLNSFEFNSSVSCLSYSEANNSVWVGTDNGAVHMISSPGALSDVHPSVVSGKCSF